MKLRQSVWGRTRGRVAKYSKFLGVGIFVAVLATLTMQVYAEDGDDLTRIVDSNGFPSSLWSTSGKNQSPDPQLNWIFDGAGAYTNGMEHVIKNEISSEVRKTNLRVYFPTNPGTFNFDIDVVDVCAFNAPVNNTLNMTVNGTLVYSQRAGQEPERITSVTEFWRYQPWRGQGDTHFLVKQDTTGTAPRESRICANIGDEQYTVTRYNEKCGQRNAQNLCRGRDTNNNYSLVAPEDDYNNPYEPPRNNSPISSGCGSGTCMFERGYWGTINPTPDPDTGLYYADITVDLVGEENNQNIRQQLRYKLNVTTPGAIVGYRPAAVTEFGVAASLDSNRQAGVKIAVPFGLGCTEPSGYRTLGLYDPDRNNFGPTYGTVYKKDPETGRAYRLTQAEYLNLDKASFENTSSGGRLQFYNGGQQSGSVSTFGVNLQAGWQYMLIISNPYNASYPKSPLGNVLSVQLPTYSIPGLFKCYFKLTPNIDTVQGTFQGSPNIPVHGFLGTDGGNVIGARDWRVSKIVFDSRPTFKAANDQTTEDPCAWMRSGNPPGRDCSSLANNSYPATSDWRGNFTDPANYPLGTYVCFVTSVRQPEFGFQANEWSHSNMTCSVKGAMPKVQVWGHDVQSGSEIQTSVTSMNARAYGSWGEYALLSAGRNNGMASASRLAVGNPSQTQASWLELTASNTPGCGAGTYGCYGTQSYPQSIVDGIKALSSVPCSGDVATSAINIGDKNNVTGTHVICSTGTVTVDTNIQYAATNTKSDLPQVLIVARDIVIADAVGRIDAWLVAGNGNSTTGTVYTCSSWRTVSTQLTSAVCPTRLVVNGPVIAPRILLGRTFDNEVDNFRDGAETVNLRADTFIWSSQGSGDIGAETVTVKELPPRY